MRHTAYAIKAAIGEVAAPACRFDAQKTMYGGKQVRRGDRIYLFDVERGLLARGTVADARPLPLQPGLARQTPRVSIRVERCEPARRALGRAELRPYGDWGDGRPETELNFKFHRQSTPKIVGIADATADFLDRHFA